MLQWAERLHPQVAEEQASLLGTVPKVAKSMCKGQPEVCLPNAVALLERVLHDPDAEQARADLAAHPSAAAILRFAEWPWIHQGLYWADEECVQRVAAGLHEQSAQIARALCAGRSDETCVQQEGAWVQSFAKEAVLDPDRYYNQVDDLIQTEALDAPILWKFSSVLANSCLN